MWLITVCVYQVAWRQAGSTQVRPRRAILSCRSADSSIRNGYPYGKATPNPRIIRLTPVVQAQSLGLHRDTQGLVASGLVSEVDRVVREQTWAGCVIADGSVHRALVLICLDSSPLLQASLRYARYGVFGLTRVRTLTLVER